MANTVRDSIIALLLGAATGGAQNIGRRRQEKRARGQQIEDEERTKRSALESLAVSLGSPEALRKVMIGGENLPFKEPQLAGVPTQEGDPTDERVDASINRQPLTSEILQRLGKVQKKNLTKKDRQADATLASTKATTANVESLTRKREAEINPEVERFLKEAEDIASGGGPTVDLQPFIKDNEVVDRSGGLKAISIARQQLQKSQLKSELDKLQKAVNIRATAKKVVPSDLAAIQDSVLREMAGPLRKITHGPLKKPLPDMVLKAYERFVAESEETGFFRVDSLKEDREELMALLQVLRVHAGSAIEKRIVSSKMIKDLSAQEIDQFRKNVVNAYMLSLGIDITKLATPVEPPTSQAVTPQAAAAPDTVQAVLDRLNQINRVGR